MKNFLALKASAGSGKTFALSVRFIALILDGARPSEIMALTFTNKAAQEMKSKIIRAFLELDYGDSRLDELCKELNLAPEEVLRRRNLKKDEFLKANLKISTFDSFFSSILRIFALNLGINSNFSVESDKKTKTLTKEKFITQISKNSALLKELAIYILTAQNGQDDFFDTLENMYESIDTLKIKSAQTFPNSDEIFKILSNLKHFAIKKGGSSTAINSFNANSVDEILKKSFLARDSFEYRTYSKIYEPIMDDMLYELKTELKGYCAKFEQYKFAKLSEILQIYKNIRKSVVSDLNILTFSDIAKFVHELLVGQENTQMLYFRLDARINHLLIDEFQDTNITQYEILKPLINEIVAGYGQNGLGSFFYVGDVKQSIYKFRGAIKELFDKLASDYKQINTLNLSTNYRSDKVIIEFVNELFKDRIKNYIPQLVNSKNMGYIKVINSIINDDTELKNSVAKSAALEAQALIEKGVKSTDIAVLCWKNKDIDEIKKELLGLNINSSGEGANLLFNTPFVRSVLEYAKFCLTGDRIYKLNVQGLIKKELVKLEIDHRKTPSQTIIYLLKHLNIDLADADIIDFIAVSRKYTNIVELVFADDNTLSASKDSDGVKLMTVHKSKGLQFSYLILCDKMGQDSNDKSKFTYQYDTELNKWEIALRMPGREHIDEDYANLLEKSKLLNLQEDLNKLYVALTRAERALIIVKNEAANKGGASFFNTIKLESSDREPVLPIDEREVGILQIYKGGESAEKRPLKAINLAQISTQDIKTKYEDENLDLNSVNFGLALHYTLENLDEFSKNSLDKAIMKSKNKYAKFLDSQAFDDIKNRVNLVINSAEFTQILKDKELYKELAFKVDGSLKQIDLLAAGEGEICIIDYKSSMNFIEKNKAQVEMYKVAISAIYPSKDVNSYIMFILKDEVRILKV